MEIRWVERLIGDATNEAIGASMIKVLQYRTYCLVRKGKEEIVGMTDWQDVPTEVQS